MSAKWKSVVRSEVMKKPKLLERLATSFQNLPEECVVHVFQYLFIEDLNAVTMCSHLCRSARQHPSLNQKRRGDIICSDSTSVLQIKKALWRGDWNDVEYFYNRTELVIQKFEKLTCVRNEEEMERREESRDIILTAVEDLVLFTTERNIEWSIPPGAYEKLSRGDGSMPKNRCLWEVMDELSRALPNVLTVHFSGIIPLCKGWSNGPADLASRLYMNFPKLESFCWDGSGWGDWGNERSTNRLSMDGSEFENCGNLRQLYLDRSRFSPPYNSQPWARDSVYEGYDRRFYWFSKVEDLTYLSIRSAWYTVEVEEEDEDGYPYDDWIDVPITQGMLMKMVRLTPTLRWLRSDLTDENVEILRRERPDVTFVSAPFVSD
jgi:hypothetical protein